MRVPDGPNDERESPGQAVRDRQGGQAMEVSGILMS
jgi:hypothetical protein